MSETTKDAILALQSGNSNRFNEIIGTELLSRAKDAIAVEKVQAGQTFFDQPEDDDDDDYDED